MLPKLTSCSSNRASMSSITGTLFGDAPNPIWHPAIPISQLHAAPDGPFLPCLRHLSHCLTSPCCRHLQQVPSTTRRAVWLFLNRDKQVNTEHANQRSLDMRFKQPIPQNRQQPTIMRRVRFLGRLASALRLVHRLASPVSITASNQAARQSQ